jgi:23S rRNA (guanosine2251-2'-O)-methyltransferase
MTSHPHPVNTGRKNFRTFSKHMDDRGISEVYSSIMSKDPKDGHTPKDTHYANLRRAHRDQKRERGELPAKSPGAGKTKEPWKAPQLPAETVWLYGIHTVKAALDNPERKLLKLRVTRNALARLELNDAQMLGFTIEIVSPQDIDKLTGSDAIHQGVLLEARPLPVRKLDSLKDRPLLLVLDQVTDPHNVGAIMRSAVAFDAGAVITTERHSPTESGVLAKSASGALEMIRYVQITNLADALEELKTLGFQTIGLDSEGPAPLEGTFAGNKVALVLGAEGRGLRQKTRATCDALARLDMPGAIKSLNVSNAAAISLYAARSHLMK